MNDQVPICPAHNAPMRMGNYGYYCTQFVGIGMQGANAKGYCDQKAGTPMQRPAQQYAPPQQPQQQAPIARTAPPQQYSGPPNGAPNRDRIIFAQTAVKASCEFYAGKPATETVMFGLAEQLFNAFARVEQGQPLRFTPPNQPATPQSAPPFPGEPPSDFGFPGDPDIDIPF